MLNWHHKIKFWLVAGITILGLAAGGVAISANAQARTLYSYHQSAQVGQNEPIQGRELNLRRASAAVAMDGRTGQVVYQKNANQPRLVASTGKLMTFYLAERKLAQRPQNWDQRVTASAPIIRMGQNPTLDGFRFVPGQRYRIGQIFRAAFVGSADNATIRLGQWVGGSNRHFIYMMNKQARLWHLNANFTSASGLENADLAPYGFWVRGRLQSGNTVSAKSLAIITYHLIHDFPRIMRLSRLHNTYVDGQRMHNYDNVLPGRRFYEKHLHTDGLKTGWTPAAGYCFVGTGKRPGKDRLITVVLNDPTEFSDTDDLMNFVYGHSGLYQR